MQQRGRPQHDGGAEKPCPADEKRAHTCDESIRNAQVGRPLAAPIQDEQLMPDQHGFGDHAADSARHCQPNHDDNQMHQKNQELPHLGNRIKLRQTLDFARILGIRHGQVQFIQRNFGIAA